MVEQEYSGGYEILIGEDHSTDDTLAVCWEFQGRFPELIRLISHSENVGMHANFRALWEAASGEYIAFCEGDDYWTDPLKLKKQVEFLRHHPECNLCGALTKTVEKDHSGVWSDVGQIGPNKVQETYSFEELIARYNFHFSSVMLRKSSVAFPGWFEQMYCVDRPLYLLSAQDGRAGLIPESMSVYRLHEGGNWSAIRQIEKAERSIALFTRMIEHFDPKYAGLFNETLGDILWSYLTEELLWKYTTEAKKIFWLSIRYQSLSQLVFHAVRNCKVFIRLYLISWFARSDVAK